MKNMHAADDPFRPIELVVNVLLAFLTVVLLLMAVLAFVRIAQGRPADVTSAQIGMRYETCIDLPLAPAGLTAGAPEMTRASGSSTRHRARDR